MTDKEITISEEYCPHCNYTVSLPPYKGIYECPECGKLIVNCGVCEDMKCNNCKYSRLVELPEQLQREEQKCEKLKVKLMQKDEVNMFFNTPVDGWNNAPCQICPYKQDFQRLQVENEGLRKANIHIENNRRCKASKLKRIERLIINCQSGYTDEFIQSVLAILLENEPSVTDLNIIDRYEQALEWIKNNPKYGNYVEFQNKINEVLKNE